MASCSGCRWFSTYPRGLIFFPLIQLGSQSVSGHSKLHRERERVISQYDPWNLPTWMHVYPTGPGSIFACIRSDFGNQASNRSIYFYVWCFLYRKEGQRLPLSVLGFFFFSHQSWYFVVARSSTWWLVSWSEWYSQCMSWCLSINAHGIWGYADITYWTEQTNMSQWWSAII